MAGSMRFESSVVSPDNVGFIGGYQNGLKGSHPSAILDRSGSFREGSEGRIFGSGMSTTPRGSASSSGDVPPVTQCLLLNPIPVADHKYTWTGEARRALGISSIGTSEDGSFGAAHSKLSSPMGTEELKRFKSSVLDASFKARGRIKRLNESLLRLNKYSEALYSKKPQRHEIPMNERSSGSNFLKVGFQLPRIPSDPGSQKLEDKTKNTVLNKRVRSSMTDTRVGNTIPNQRQSVAMGKERDVLRDGGEGFDMAEEKVRRFPAGGEGWDKKMKRKRSVGSVFGRPPDNDVETKRPIQQKFGMEPGVTLFDGQNLRTGSIGTVSGINKSEGTPSPVSSNSRSFPRNESDKLSSRDITASMNKERPVPKLNSKLNGVEGNHFSSLSPVTKGKATRAPRTGSISAATSSPNLSRASASVDGCEQIPSVNKTNSISGQHNRKRSLPPGSSSPPMAQWVGQRPHKISRTRRSNVVSPVLNHEEAQLPLENGEPSGSTAREASAGTGMPHFPKELPNGTHQLTVKLEVNPSPARPSESEESGALENHKGTSDGSIEEKSMNPNVGPILITKKNKLINKEDLGDDVQRQGRTGRSMTSSRGSISPSGEKLETPLSKPVNSTKPVSEKNSSKSGRPPLKKISHRKGANRLAQPPASNSPDLPSESDDDREELLAAASAACNFSYLSCSGSFWKKAEPFFAPISLEDLSYLKQQSNPDEQQKGMIDFSSRSGDDMGNFAQEDLLHSYHWKGNDVNEILPATECLRGFGDQGPDGSSYGNYETRNIGASLYQRVLSALIVEDEYEENCNGSIPGFLSQCCSPNGFMSDGIMTNSRGGSHMHNHLCDDALFRGGNGFVTSHDGTYPLFSGDDDADVLKNAAGDSEMDCLYEQMSLQDKLLMELQTVGLCPEKVPDLADGESKLINEEIVELQKRLTQQIGQKKVLLDKLTRAVEESRLVDSGALEQVAMDRLVELAYKRLLAIRGSSAAKLGIPKVSRPVALSFMKRTLSRCREFEDAGKSCFSEPTLHDVLLSKPNHGNKAETADAANVPSEIPNSHQQPKASDTFSVEQHDIRAGNSGRPASDVLHDPDFAKTGPIWNRGKKKEVLLDDVGGNKTSSPLGNNFPGGAKGKRSERDKSKPGRDSKVGRSPQNNVKGDRKTKSKVKQKAASLSSPEDGSNNKLQEGNSNKKRETAMPSNRCNNASAGREATDASDLHDLDIELGVDNFGGQQDLSNWFDVDGLPDNEGDLDLSMVGLEIPMDDLTELSVYL